MPLTQEEKKKIIEEEKLRQAMQGKSTVVAVILSIFVPGLGDLYCGSWIKALFFFLLDVVGLIMVIGTLGIGLIFFIPVWIAGLISAWLSANKSAKRRIRKVERSNLNTTL